MGTNNVFLNTFKLVHSEGYLNLFPVIYRESEQMHN